MHRDDPQYFRRVGEIITSRGNAEQVSASSFIFSSSSLRSSLALLDYRQNETNAAIEERTMKVREALAPFIGKTLTPNSMVDHLLFSSYTTKALQDQHQQGKSELFGAHFDSGSKMFQHIGGQEGWNIIDTPVTAYSEYNKITPLDAILRSFTENEFRRERRKRIVADAISVISGMAMHILQITQGRVTYIPLGSCVYVASISKTDKIVLLVNDPTGQGWKILPYDEVDYNDPSELLEFSVKNVTGSLFDQFKISVLSSGTLTSEGTGAVTVIDKDAFNQVFLEEGRIYISGSTKVVTVNVHPDKIEEEQAAKRIRRGNEGQRKSPSAFSWFNFKETRKSTVIDLSGSDIREDEHDVLPFKRNVSGTGAGGVCKSTSNRLVDKGGWADHLLRLEKFTQKTSDHEKESSRKLLENLATCIGLVTFLGSRDDENEYAPSVTTDTDDEYIKAAYSLIDFNGEIGVNLLPIMERSSENDIVCFSVIGNSPNSQSTRVVRFLKRTTRPPAERSSHRSNCNWVDVAPTSIVSTGDKGQCSKDEGTNTVKTEPIFLYTPRCIFHSLTASIHMFSDSEGPVDNMNIDGEGYKLTLDSNSTANIPVDSIVNLVNKPLVTATVSSTLQRDIVVNGNQVARPLELFVARAGDDNDEQGDSVKRNKESDIRFMISTERGDTKEFMDKGALKSIRWYEIQTGFETRAPECLLQKVDDRGRILNMVLTEITVKAPRTECAGGDAGERGLPGNTIKIKCSSRNTRYPCPHGKTLIKYGLLASSDAIETKITKQVNSDEEIYSDNLKIIIAMAQ